MSACLVPGEFQKAVVAMATKEYTKGRIWRSGVSGVHSFYLLASSMESGRSNKTPSSRRGPNQLPCDKLNLSCCVHCPNLCTPAKASDLGLYYSMIKVSFVSLLKEEADPQTWAVDHVFLHTRWVLSARSAPPRRSWPPPSRAMAAPGTPPQRER